MLGSSGERFSACVYPSKAGTRIALVIERSVSGGIVGGAIVGFIRNAIQGDEKDGAKKLQDEMLMQVRKTLPDVLVELSELPGGQRSTLMLTRSPSCCLRRWPVLHDPQPRTRLTDLPAMPSLTRASSSSPWG